MKRWRRSLKRSSGRESCLIRAAKFLHPVRPGDAVRMRWRVTDARLINFECRLVDRDILAASFSLRNRQVAGMSENALAQEWMVRPERGSLPAVKFGVWLALRLGRPLARLLLYPICLYFLVSSRPGRETFARLSRARARPRPG